MKNKKQLILCVDDEKIVLDSLRRQLQELYGNNFFYEVAESPIEALELIEEICEENKDSIVLVISDWLMPGIKGDEFLIQFHQKFPNSITIMLTGQADDIAIQNAKNNANLYCCLRKPWTKEELHEKMEAAFAVLQNKQ